MNIQLVAVYCSSQAEFCANEYAVLLLGIFTLVLKYRG